MRGTEEAADQELDEEEKLRLEEALNDEHESWKLMEGKEAKKKGAFKKKVKFISKMLIMQKILREKHEMILQIKNQNNDKLPQGLLGQGKEAMDLFMKVAEEDSQNEMMPN